MEYPAALKVQVLDEAARLGNVAQAAREYGVSRRSVHLWQKQEESIRAEYKAEQESRGHVVALEDVNKSLDEVHNEIKAWAATIDGLDRAESRKRIYVSVIEKEMMELLSALDKRDKGEMKYTEGVKALKELNEVREKLAGDPTVIVEYRAKFQANVLTVLRDMLDKSQLKDFVERMERMEEAEYREV